MVSVFKPCAGWKKKKKKKEKGRCESEDCKGLEQRLNIRVAHIRQEKQAESPTQTSLSATEAQRPTDSASKTH